MAQQPPQPPVRRHTRENNRELTSPPRNSVAVGWSTWGFLNRAKGDKKPRGNTESSDSAAAAGPAPKESKVTAAEVEAFQRKEVRWVGGGESLEDHPRTCFKGVKIIEIRYV